MNKCIIIDLIQKPKLNYDFSDYSQIEEFYNKLHTCESASVHSQKFRCYHYDFDLLYLLRVRATLEFVKKGKEGNGTTSNCLGFIYGA